MGHKQFCKRKANSINSFFEESFLEDTFTVVDFGYVLPEKQSRLMNECFKKHRVTENIFSLQYNSECNLNNSCWQCFVYNIQYLHHFCYCTVITTVLLSFRNLVYFSLFLFHSAELSTHYFFALDVLKELMQLKNVYLLWLLRIQFSLQKKGHGGELESSINVKPVLFSQHQWRVQQTNL